MYSERALLSFNRIATIYSQAADGAYD